MESGEVVWWEVVRGGGSEWSGGWEGVDVRGSAG